MVVASTAARGLGLRCAITGLSTVLSTHPFDDAEARRLRLQGQVRQWALDNVDMVQIREKTLEAGEMLSLVSTALETLRSVPGSRTQLLVNGRADVAAAAGAHGVQLSARAGELRPDQVRSIFSNARSAGCVVGVSCHTSDEVRAARDGGADLVLFGPVFEKRVAGERIAAGVGLDRLREACLIAEGMPVLALGGVTPGTAGLCLAAGAAGVAGIRAFAQAHV